MRALWREYWAIYRECSDWLAERFPPWRWFAGTYDQIRLVRRMMEDTWH